MTRSDEILDQLSSIESRYDVRILYASESGSRAWGFESPDSDWDVRFIYTRRLESYLRIHDQPRDVIELPISNDLDINGWDLKKALGLVVKGNAALTEWFASPIVYCQDDEFASALKSMLPSMHRPDSSFYHYIHMAKGNFREYLQSDMVRTKKYLYVLRPLLAANWVISGLGAPPILFDDLVAYGCSNKIIDQPTEVAIKNLLRLKRNSPEVGLNPRDEVINIFIANQLAELESKAFEYSKFGLKKSIDFEPLNSLFYKTVVTS